MLKFKRMLLESIEAHNFRNLSGEVFWGKGLNIILGENGQGKTNWLEAIYLLATTKSFRTQRPQEAIRFGENLSVVRGRVARTRDVHRDLQITLQGGSKTLSLNGKRETVASYLSQLHVVPFTADELEVVRGGPESRRRFLDRGVLSLHHSYVQTLADYQRVVKQKNRLLQDISDSEMNIDNARAMIEPWNEQIILLGATIHRARSDYVERLGKSLQQRLFEREEITIRYVSALEGKGNLEDYESLISERLQLRLTAEIASGYALIGPHRDDLKILFDGRDIRTYGSSGQQRSALILLDLAAISVYYLWHNEYPLFLMDDVDAELDKRRIGHLLEYLEGRTQTFITTSKNDLIKEFAANAKLFDVRSGVAFDTAGGELERTIATSTEGI
ncbi:MAG: replication and repair protein RecF [Acidobacteriota bacterium]|jgi:DNA replication and repair protein RecF|nr:replication and repair protein RecF [Acidobacteriota bacterium]MDT7780203.1 replication and repair protein RecF [Acidobacteriota bacterium]